MTKKAFVTGITGQDGYYISKLLLERGYSVYGFVRGKDNLPTDLKKDDFWKEIIPVYGDLDDQISIKRAVEYSEPDEIYNIGAVSDLSSAIKDPARTMRVNYEAVLTLINTLQAINPKSRFCQASSSQIFASDNLAPQNENSCFGFSNPYGEAKLKAHLKIIEYREKDGLFACSAILFNHESPRRGKHFVTRKITHTLARIKNGYDEVLELGNLDSKRDWGFAGDYVEAMWMMLQQDKPEDYVIATGESHTVREFVQKTADAIGMRLNWEGAGVGEKAKDENGRIIVQVNPDFYRPVEVNDIVGDITKAKSKLGWSPKLSFEELVSIMAISDFNYVKNISVTN